MKNPIKQIYNAFKTGKSLNDKKKGSYTNTQLARIRHDFGTWREAMDEAEQDYMPFRVKQQQLYNDTILNGHVIAAIEKRKNLSLLKDFAICKEDGTEDIPEVSKQFRNKDWFKNLCSHILDSNLYGYNLINWSGLNETGLTGLTIYPRHLVSPDRRNYTNYQYIPSGKSVDDEEISDWTLFVETPSLNGQSSCGYGLLYWVALYEIVLRNNLGDNTTYNELNGLPFVHAKTTADGEEREQLKNSLDARGGNTVLISDINDEINFLSGNSQGQGHLTFGDLEKRSEQKVSKILLGHADAMDSTAGKLGNQGTGDDGVGKALRAIESIDNKFLENVINNQLFRKLRNLGFYLPEGLYFKFKNDKESEEIREKKNNSNKLIADTVKVLADSGLEVDPVWVEENTGIPVTKKIEQQPTENKNISQSIKNKLDKLYI